MILPPWILDIWNTHYLKATSIALGTYVVMQVLLFITEKVVLRITAKTKTDIDDIIVQRTRKSLAFLVLLIGMRMAAEVLQFSEIVNLNIERSISTIIAITVGHAVAVTINALLKHAGKKAAAKTASTVDDHVIEMGRRFVRIIVYTVVGIVILNLWGVKVGPLLASLGIAGIAVAFALQSSLANIFGGVSLIVDKSIRLGDTIQLEDGTAGTVVRVSLRSTRIQTTNNEVIIVPNGKFADSRITNLHLPDKKLRLVLPFGVAYGSDVEKVKNAVASALRKDKEIVKEPKPEVLFTAMGDFAMNFVARFWISDADYRTQMTDKGFSLIYDALNSAKITIPFPTRTVILKKEE